jgi:opacity protein-like surface antigen
MKKILLLVALFASGPALAQTSGWYIGGGVGTTKADFVRSDFTTTGLATGAYSADDDDVAGRIFGGYRVASNWAVEFGLATLGRYKHRYNNAGSVAVYDYDASALTVAAAAQFPVGGGVSLNGRLGIAFTATELQLRRDNGTANPPFCPDSWWYSDCSSQSTNLYWGLGAQFDVSPRWGIRLDYDNYGEVGDEFETGRADIETMSVSFLWRF